LTADAGHTISSFIEMKEPGMPLLIRAVPVLAGLFGKRLELCCPGGARNASVDALKREGLHFGRLR
jgi:hypothetical protein